MAKKKYIIGVCGLGSRTDKNDIMKWLKKNDLFEKGMAVPTYRIGTNSIWCDYWIITKEMNMFHALRLLTWMTANCVGYITDTYIDVYKGQNPKDYYKVKE